MPACMPVCMAVRRISDQTPWPPPLPPAERFPRGPSMTGRPSSSRAGGGEAHPARRARPHRNGNVRFMGNGTSTRIANLDIRRGNGLLPVGRPAWRGRGLSVRPIARARSAAARATLSVAGIKTAAETAAHHAATGGPQAAAMQATEPAVTALSCPRSWWSTPALRRIFVRGRAAGPQGRKKGQAAKYRRPEACLKIWADGNPTRVSCIALRRPKIHAGRGAARIFKQPPAPHAFFLPKVDRSIAGQARDMTDWFGIGYSLFGPRSSSLKRAWGTSLGNVTKCDNPMLFLRCTKHIVQYPGPGSGGAGPPEEAELRRFEIAEIIADVIGAVQA